LKFKPDDDGGIEMEVGIAFVKDRVKDSVKGQINENMDDLFSQRKDAKQADGKTIVDVENIVAIDKGKAALGSGNWTNAVEE
jgi:hypothetical protein